MDDNNKITIRPQVVTAMEFTHYIDGKLCIFSFLKKYFLKNISAKIFAIFLKN